MHEHDILRWVMEPGKRGDTSMLPTRMPCGQFRGMPFADCPREYLEWLLQGGYLMDEHLRAVAFLLGKRWTTQKEDE